VKRALMRRKRTIVALCLAGILFGIDHGSLAEALEKWGPFRGRIVDVETGQPIRGAAVLVIWWEEVYTPVQTNTKFYEAREAVTDADGRFEVPRLTPPFFTFRIREPQVTYFAAGYVAEAEVVTPPDGQPFVAPTIVQMRRLKTPGERRKYILGRLPGGVPHERMPEFIRALNEELSALGLGTYR
jgi:hypothetical protein